jgi:hypothetical protein
MNGYVQFTGDETKARATITDRLRAACGAEVKLLQLDMQRADSVVGVRHMHYTAVGECVGQELTSGSARPGE